MAVYDEIAEGFSGGFGGGFESNASAYGGLLGNATADVSEVFNPDASGGAVLGGSASLSIGFITSGGAVVGGGYKENFYYTGSGGIVLGGEAASEVTFNYDLPLVWDVRKYITIETPFVWDVGTQPMQWFRVEGCCSYTTANGDGQADSGGSLALPGGCDVIGFQTPNDSCGYTKATFFQNIAATSLTKLCEYLQSVNWKWPICSIQRYTRPADNRFVNPDNDCNELVDVPFDEIPECLEYTVRNNNTVDMAMTVTASSAIYRYEGSGGISLSGEADATTDGNYGYDFSYHGSGEVVLGGSAESRIILDTGHETDMAMTAALDSVEIIYAAGENLAPLERSADLANTNCGCSLPQVLELTHNLENANVFRDFCLRNGISIPKTIDLNYSSRSKSWQGSLHYRGLTDSSETEMETWRLIFEWGCVDSLGENELGTSVWKFSLSVLRKNSTTGMDFDTRLMIVFPADPLCGDDAFNFDFRFDTQKLFVKTNLDMVVDVGLLYDNVGIFRSLYWKKNPFLKINVAEVAPVDNFDTQDIRPIFPANSIFLTV